MTLQQHRISDQIRLSTIQTNRFKTGLLTFTVTLPLTPQNAAMNAVLSGVLRRGTVSFPSMAALNRRLDDLYASCVEIRSGRIGANLALTFTAEVLDECYVPDSMDLLDGVMEVVSEMLLSPKLTAHGFDPAQTEQEKQFALDAINGEINNTRSYAVLRLGELMNRQDPTYPTLQEMKARISAITPDSLYTFYRELQCASPLEVFYIGSLSCEAVSRKLERHLLDWNGAATHRLRFPVALMSQPFLSETERMPVSQGKLAMGFHTGICAQPDRDEVYAALVFNELFGGSPASKLFLNVREALSLCYYCSSSYSQYSGILTVSSGIDPKNRFLAEKTILEQLTDLQNGSITHAELHAAKLSLDNAYRQLEDNPFELQTFFGNRGLFGLSLDPEECRRKLHAVSVEEIVSVARKVTYDASFFIDTVSASDTQEEPSHE